MFWTILVLLIILILASFIAFKYGEIRELHNVRAEFEHYLDAHSTVEDSIKKGIEIAENIVDHILEEETIWK